MLSDQRMRTSVHDRIQQVLRSHDLLVTPTLAALPVDNAEDGNTVGPSSIEGVDVDPVLIAAAQEDFPDATWVVEDLAELGG